MDLSLSDVQQALLDTVRQFAIREVKPLAAALDREHRFPAELVARMAELGLMGIEVPEAYDGADLPLSHANALEVEAFAGLFATADQKEGMAAFLGKRKANFVGDFEP